MEDWSWSNVFKVRVSSSQHFLYSERLKGTVGLEMARDGFLALRLGRKVPPKLIFWVKWLRDPTTKAALRNIKKFNGRVP